MAAGIRSTRGVLADINVTPLIDVLLVLLVVFLVLQQAPGRHVAAQVPPIDPAAPSSAPDEIVLEVGAGDAYRLNRSPVAAGALESKLVSVYAARPRKVLFVRGSPEASYGEVVRAMDAARAAGVEVVGLVPRAAVGRL